MTYRTILALGYYISMDKPPSRIKNVRLPNDPFMQVKTTLPDTPKHPDVTLQQGTPC